jgi:tight adherence protein C
VIAEALAFGAASAGVAACALLRPRRPRVRRRPAPPGLGSRRPHRARIASALAASAFGLLAGGVLPGRLAFLAAVAAPALGFLAPDLWLARRRAERVTAFRSDMPALLDLLAVTVEAGLSLPAALAEVGVPLADALEAHARDVAIPEVESFTGALLRAVRHGAPLGDTLAAQAREIRLARRRAIQEQAARAGPKMQLVVALLLVPSVMLLVAAALVGALADGAQGALQFP